ncbi:MAG: methylenetetrahydrofolate--tRNA-(uracil(54)-C(5))-methyltransferase (FADH(2)-oxidizing) TrmFO [Clostridia bacterium]|nr:methylenetetrahydrofolate--tRNA-(uracil(54)-C(5))-methyltransferase (FADH(2)-oxidizing) TrmFO [Clostridia bacterium]
MTMVQVVGAGLAGCEAAVQLARRGVAVRLFDMKPAQRSPAHHSDRFAELVCSNSLKAARVSAAAGLLKEEMRRFGSVCMAAADVSSVPAGGALAVDRDRFSEEITRVVENCPGIEIIHSRVDDWDPAQPTILATGPLTEDRLFAKIAERCGGALSFYDAAAPIVTTESVNMSLAFRASRYDRGGDDYINCPMNRAEYEAFYYALVSSERADQKDLEKGLPLYEGCMPIERMAMRGQDTIRFGPLKPVGLRDPRTGHRPWANVQLRAENREGTLCNLVGFQTNLKFAEQKRVFSLIPALHDAEFVRYGVMHRNSFLRSPQVLNVDLSMKEAPLTFFAGQITGVEGYMESASSGILAGVNMARKLGGEAPLILPRFTMLGALTAYVTQGGAADFQPMGANFGILPPLDAPIRDKRERGEALAARSLLWYDQNEGVLKS